MRFLLLVLLSFLGFSTLDAQPGDLSDILAAQANYEANTSEENRQTLLTALSAYDGAPTVQTVQAHWLVMMNDTKQGNYKNMRESALAVEAHVAPVSGILPQQYVESKFIAAIAHFNHRQDRDALIEMTHVEGMAKTYRDGSGTHPDWADRLSWQADAWGMTMQAYYKSTNKRHASETEIESILQDYWDQLPNGEPNAETNETQLPTCPGQMVQKPRLKYPFVKAMRGRFGAVILRFELDEEGQVQDPKVLASVPVEEFEDQAIRTVRKWRLKPDRASNVGVTCRLSSSNVVLPIVFQLQ